MPLRVITVGSDRTLRRDGAVQEHRPELWRAMAHLQPAQHHGLASVRAEQDAMLDIAQTMKVKVLRVKATSYHRHSGIRRQCREEYRCSNAF